MDKAIFYVIGGCFAAWAVLIAILGFNRPDFPSRTATSRLVMALTVLLAVGSVASGIATS